MHYSSIRNHLKPYVIVARRKTTINHAFAAAIAPSDDYFDVRVREAIVLLGQDPDKALLCSYCGELAQTWDHVFATVKNSHFSGHGHRLGNLLPCCKRCNSAKGNRDWRMYITSLGLPLPHCEARVALIEGFLGRYANRDPAPAQSPEYLRLMQVKEQVMLLLADADQLAKTIRERQHSGD